MDLKLAKVKLGRPLKCFMSTALENVHEIEHVVHQDSSDCPDFCATWSMNPTQNTTSPGSLLYCRNISRVSVGSFLRTWCLLFCEIQICTCMLITNAELTGPDVDNVTSCGIRSHESYCSLLLHAHSHNALCLQWERFGNLLITLWMGRTTQTRANWTTEDKGKKIHLVFFHFSAVRFQRVCAHDGVRVFVLVWQEWTLMWASAVVVHSLEGLMRYAFGDAFLLTTFVKSSYLGYYRLPVSSDESSHSPLSALLNKVF